MGELFYTGISFSLQSLRPMFDQPTPVKAPFKQPVLHNKNDDIAFRTDHLSTVYDFNAKVCICSKLELSYYL